MADRQILSLLEATSFPGLPDIAPILMLPLDFLFSLPFSPRRAKGQSVLCACSLLPARPSWKCWCLSQPHDRHLVNPCRLLPGCWLDTMPGLPWEKAMLNAQVRASSLASITASAILVYDQISCPFLHSAYANRQQMWERWPMYCHTNECSGPSTWCV